MYTINTSYILKNLQLSDRKQVKYAYFTNGTKYDFFSVMLFLPGAHQLLRVNLLIVTGVGFLSVWYTFSALTPLVLNQCNRLPGKIRSKTDSLTHLLTQKRHLACIISCFSSPNGFPMDSMDVRNVNFILIRFLKKN